LKACEAREGVNGCSEAFLLREDGVAGAAVLKHSYGSSKDSDGGRKRAHSGGDGLADGV
jgi:hypothetical protein